MTVPEFIKTNMLEAINNVSRDKSNRLLCLGSKSAGNVNLNQFQQDLTKMKAKIADVDATSWLLYSEDTYLFLLGFMALLGLNKKVMICASCKPEWVSQFEESFDAVLIDDGVINTAKPTISFSLTGEECDLWYPSYTGKEQIIFFTSGSTGQPKSIEKPLISLLNEVSTLEIAFAEKLKGSVYVASVSHLHIYGLLFKMLLPLLTKGCWVNQQVEYPEQLFPISRDVKKMIFVSSPAFLSRLDLKLDTIKAEQIFSSGGPLSSSAANDSLKYFGVLPIEVYGSTETGGIAYRQQYSAATPWAPFNGVRFKGEDHGVRVFSPHVADISGIMLDDNLEFGDSGDFILKGRKDRVLKIEEKRVSLTELEKYLEEFDAIEKCVVVIVAGKRDVIGCAVVLSDTGKAMEKEKSFRHMVKQWKASMSERFELVTIPKKWRLLDAIPLNSQSKIDVFSLLSNFQSERNENK